MTVHNSSIAALVAATPGSRDRYVDFLRAFSIAVVVFGHWLMTVVYLDDGELSGASILEVVPWVWAATWFLQVMPLFFFVGGFSNLTSWNAHERRGGTYFDFVAGRVARLMRPSAVFIGIWLAGAVILEVAAPATAARLQPALAIIAKPLWFIAVYLVVVAMAPAMLWLHRRYGARVPLMMIVGAALVDVLRIALGLPFVGFLNFAFVWLFAHQLGFFYADGSFANWTRRRLASFAAFGLGALVILTAFGPYSPSMVGMADGRVSNNDPPSVCIVALTVWLIGIAMLARARMSGWLEGRREWAAVIAANSMIMTVFLWHLTALLLAVVVLYPLGWPQPVGGTAEWWLLRPVWMAVLTIFLVPFVVAFARFERPRGRPPIAVAGGSLARAATGIAALTFGIAGFAADGFGDALSSGAPISNAALVGVGALLLKPHRPAQDDLLVRCDTRTTHRSPVDTKPAPNRTTPPRRPK
jgi:fucose 4-O-acetylase-like acetyltransferase